MKINSVLSRTAVRREVFDKTVGELRGLIGLLKSENERLSVTRVPREIAQELASALEDFDGSLGSNFEDEDGDSPIVDRARTVLAAYRVLCGESEATSRAEIGKEPRP